MGLSYIRNLGDWVKYISRPMPVFKVIASDVTGSGHRSTLRLKKGAHIPSLDVEVSSQWLQGSWHDQWE